MPKKYNYESLWKIAQSFGNAFGDRQYMTIANIIPLSKLQYSLKVTRQALATLILIENDRETIELLCANYMNLPLVAPDEVYDNLVNIFGTIEMSASEEEYDEWAEQISKMIQENKISQKDLDYWAKVNRTISDRTSDALMELKVLENIAGLVKDEHSE